MSQATPQTFGRYQVLEPLGAGVFVNGALHTWKQPLTDLRRVRFNRQAKPPALEFDTLRGTLTRLGVVHCKTYTVAVPVPAGQEEQAENVARSFARQPEDA